MYSRTSLCVMNQFLMTTLSMYVVFSDNLSDSQSSGRYCLRIHRCTIFASFGEQFRWQ